MKTRAEENVHPFERTLGPGPYRFVGFFDLGACLSALNAGNVNGYNSGLSQAASMMDEGCGTCSHCGHVILNIYVVRTGNGKRYGVGSECIGAVGLPARELSAVKRAKLEHERKLRAARKQRKGDAARAELKQLMESYAHEMKGLKHPNDETKTGRSLYTYAEWCVSRSNAGGIVIALKRVQAALKVE